MDMAVQQTEQEQTTAAEEVNMERLLFCYGNAVFRTCYLYLADRALAEDAMQETFIKAYQKYHLFSQRSSEKTWLIRIAINTCKNYLRIGWKKRVSLGLTFEQKDETGVEEHLLQREQRQELLRQVALLDPKYKDVVLLFYYHNLKTAEIAEVLKIKEGTVRVRLQRAREKLKKQLRGLDWDE